MSIIFLSALFSLISGVLSEDVLEKDLILVFDKHPRVLRTDDGIFVDFLKNFFEVLMHGFIKSQLKKYLRTLHRYLSELDYRYARKLAKRVRKLTKMHREEIQDELSSYREELDKKLPHRTAFLEAMNEAFTLYDRGQLNDYILDLRDFGILYKIVIDKETDKVINNVIVGRIIKLSGKDQDDLYIKLKKAYKEYDDETDY